MASRYHTLLQKRAELLKQADALLNQDNPSAEDLAKGTQILSVQLVALDEQIAAIEQLHAAERAAPALPGITMHHDQDPRGEGADPRAGYESLAEFAVSVRHACLRTGAQDPRLAALAGHLPLGAAPTNFHRETNSSEGWMVPPQMRDEIWQLVFEGTDLLSLLTMEPTNSNSTELGADESTPWGATGIQAAWRIEGDQMTPSKLSTKGRRVDLNELYAFVSATEELLMDAPRLNARLTQGAARAIEWKASDAVMWGDGVGKPLGWGLSPALVTQAKESGQTAATVVTKNLGKMFSRLFRGAGARPLFVCNSDVLPQLLELTIGQVPVWIPQNQGMQETPGGRILGIPNVFSEHCRTLGTVGDIQLVDLSGYYATRRTDGIQFASSIHLWFDYGLQAFRWTFRMGGQPFLSAAIDPANGSNTKSHFVFLATRA